MKLEEKPYDPKELELKTYGQKNQPGPNYWDHRMCWVINNFFSYFLLMPSGNSHNREFHQSGGTMDLRPADDLPDAEYILRYTSPYNANRTKREFLDEIERVAEEIIGLKAVQKIVARWHKKRTRENSKKCFKALIPIYIRLRQNGYGRTELTGPVW